MNEYYKEKLIDFYNCLEGKKLFLFGAGKTCSRYIEKFEYKDKIEGILDNDINKVGMEILGVPILNVKKLDEIDLSKIVFLITTYYANEIYEFLIKKGAIFIYHFSEIGFNNQDLIMHDYLLEDEKKYEVAKSILNDDKSRLVFDKIISLRKSKKVFWGYGYDYDAYFAKDLLRLSDCETFVDGGAFDGDTVGNFLEITKNKYNKIYAFEPEADSYIALNNKFKNEYRIKTINLGLWSKYTSLCFNKNGVSSKITENGTEVIHVTSIDEELLKNNKIPTFIKLDIEGAELSALEGAKNTIMKYKPKIAIAIYHKNKDIWEIPLWLKKLVPEYYFFIRHHSFSLDDTVLYAQIL